MNRYLAANVHYHFSNRSGGVSEPPFTSNNFALHVPDNPEHVQRNRQALQRDLALSQLQWLDQVHGSTVIEAPAAGTPAADAMFTTQADLACAILTADCLPVLFAAHDGSQVAAAHAGWRGLAAGVLTNTLARFAEPEKVTVILGPAISQAAFEVGPEVKTAFPWASELCFKAGNGDRYYADLYRLAYEQLSRCGVEQILLHTESDTGVGRLSTFNSPARACTYTQNMQYFSYRREGETGRMAALIWLKSC